MPRLTSHGEVVYEQLSSIGVRHPYWGEMKDVWPHQPAAAPKKAGGCGSCGGGQVQLQAAVRYETLDEWAGKVAAAPSDFHEHVGTLRDLAAKCDRVAQIGIWGKPSRAALAHTPGTFADYAPGIRPEWNELGRHMSDRFKGVEWPKDGTALEIEPTDLLFIDTYHTAAETYNLLVKHAPKVSRYLVVHTTETFGDRGDDGGPGVLPGVRRFLAEHTEWTVIRADKNNHGLMVLSRADEDKKQPPGTLRKALNFAKALAAHAQAGQKLVKDSVWELRMAECLTCPHRFHDVCGKCGCPVEKKTSWAEQECPDKPARWVATDKAEDLQ